MEFARKTYLNRLIAKKHSGLVKVVTGIRRSGKSFLLNTLFFRHLISEGVPADHIISFAFDSADDLLAIGENLTLLQRPGAKVDPQRFMKYIASRMTDGNMYYLLLDEIQNLGAFEAVLNSYLRKPNMDLYVTGSNARFLSKDVITEFAGRGDEVHLLPLSFAEFMEKYPGNPQNGFDEYSLFGGLPIVVNTQGAEAKIALLNSLLQETYIKDILLRGKIRKPGEMEDLLNILASNIGALTNPEKLKATFASVKNSRITAVTLKKYLDLLQDSFLVEYARRYDVKGRHYIETPMKYYFTDLGVRNARIDFRQVEPTHTLENIIYNELRSRGFLVDIGVVPVSERDENGSSVHKMLEVDFIANKGSKRYYIQSAYALPDAAKRQQEERPLRNIDDSFKKIILTKDTLLPWYSEDGILTMSIYDFLLHPDSLEN